MPHIDKARASPFSQDGEHTQPQSDASANTQTLTLLAPRACTSERGSPSKPPTRCSQLMFSGEHSPHKLA
eukprot:4898402-Pleurochrysis_carterae.AAC.1